MSRRNHPLRGLICAVALCLWSLVTNAAVPIPDDDLVKVLPPKADSSAQAKPKVAKLPKKLPKKKTQTTAQRTKINFEEDSGTHVTTVVVRTPLPLEQALEDQQAAERERVRVVPTHASLPVQDSAVLPKMNPQPKVIAAPAPSINAAATAAPSPTPIAASPAHFQPQVTTAQVAASPVPPSLATPTPAPLPTGAPVVSTTGIVATPIVPLVAPVPAPAPTSTPTTVNPPFALTYHRIEQPSAEDPTRLAEGTRLVLRTSYVDARYSQLEGDLQNGATTLGLGLAHKLTAEFEGRASVEIGNGMDKTVTLQNTRFFLIRADALYLPLQGRITPLAGFGLGYSEYDVTSERAAPGGDITLREHANGKSLTASPSAGVRLRMTPTLSFDLTLEYLIFVGNGQSSALGGWTGALGFSFAY